MMSWESGYLGHLRLQRAQQPACAAGGVLVLESERPVKISELARAATRSYGLRREQGYGEIDLIAEPAPAAISYLEEKKLPAIPPASTQPARELALRLFHEAARRQARFTAIEIAQGVQGTLPRAALLHRLTGLLMAKTQEQFGASISSLRDRARRQLEKCRLVYRGERTREDINLSDMLKRPRHLLAGSLTHRIWTRKHGAKHSRNVRRSGRISP